jgi:hypothetical protein
MTNIKGQPANRGQVISLREFSDLWNDDRLTVQQIGDRLGVTIQAVSARAKSRGLPPRGKMTARKIAMESVPLLRSMWVANVGLREMQRHFGCCHTAITKAARRLGFPPRNATRWNIITIAEFMDQQTAARMVEAAKTERSMWAHVEMIDTIRKVA